VTLPLPPILYSCKLIHSVRPTGLCRIIISMCDDLVVGVKASEGLEKVFCYLVDFLPAFSSIDAILMIGQVPRLEVTARW